MHVLSLPHVGILLVALAGVSLADPYYRGDLRHRPRLTFDGRDAAHTQRVVARIDAQQQPWAGAYQALRSLVANGQEVDHRSSGWKGKSDKWNGLYSQETRNGHLATARAMVAWLYAQGLDPAWLPLPRRPGDATPQGWVDDQAQAARQTIERMYDDWPCWRGFGVINRGIVAADSLAMHCVAFDLLSALPQTTRGDLGTAERRLGDLASDLGYWFWTTDTYQNNHGIRVAGGLGIAAVALNRHDRYRWWKPKTWWHKPKRWFAKSERMLHPTRRRSDLRFQGSTGAWAEGTSYYHYAADLYLPFFYANERFVQGRGTRFLQADRTNDLTRWAIDLRLPDGRRAQQDNASLFRDTTPGFFLSRLPAGVRSAGDRELFLWDYAQSGFPGMAGRRGSFLLAAFDPTDQELATALARTDPGIPATLFMHTRGSAVLRTDWGPDAAHVLVQAQHGDVRKHGRGHESVANGAYAFYAHGDSITIDPGYFGFTRVKETHRGEHRSMVLVDGEGPKPARAGILGWRAHGTDTRIVRGPRTQDGAEVRSVEVTSAYRKGTIRRTVALVGQRYLVVEDLCSTRRKARRFTTQVQTNAGAAKGRPLTRQGQALRYDTWPDSVQVCVSASASAPLSISTEARVSSTGEGPNAHEAILFEARGREVAFLTAVATAPAGQAAPAVEALAASGAQALRVEAGGAVDVVVSNPGGGRAVVPASPGTAAFSSDHALAIVSFDAAGNRRVVWTVGPGLVSFP